MSKIKIERMGGLAGFGTANSHIRSEGEIELNDLSEDVRIQVEQLFAKRSKASNLNRDTFLYKLTRQTQTGTESIEADETVIPDVLKAAVQDRLV